MQADVKYDTREIQRYFMALGWYSMFSQTSKGLTCFKIDRHMELKNSNDTL